jgi:aspartokinase-like uncharacterized kinase
MVIFKLGGSLLTLPDLAARIAAVLDQRAGRPCAILVGGGAAADLVRGWDRTHALGDEAAHHLALQAMRLTARYMEALLPAACVVENTASLREAWSEDKLPLLTADAFLDEAERQQLPTIPHTWDATSDSIAAWLATELNASELVLLKSTQRPALDLCAALSAGLIDACFPDAAAQVSRLSWANLRSSDCRIEPWISRPVALH